MNYYTFFLIFLVIYGIALIGGIFVFVYYRGKWSVKDNPNEALIFVKTGLHVDKPFKAKLIETTNQGQMFYYGTKKIIFNPKKYDDTFYRNKRMIFISKQGQLVSSPFNDNVELSPVEKSDLIYDLVSSRIGADGIRALKGKSNANVIFVIIIAFIIGAVLAIGVMRFMDIQKENNAVQQTQQTQQIQQTPVESK